MDALLTAVGNVFTSAIGWVGTTASTIAGQPILLLACVGSPLGGERTHTLLFVKHEQPAGA